ncbi:Ribonuclease Z/Hydroxyacylglutathione hydrolase-like protein [Abortiporus biennis]
MSSTMASRVVVQPLVNVSQILPSHHLNASKTKFTNPWPSFIPPTASTILKFIVTSLFYAPQPPPNINDLIPIHIPDWGRDFGSEQIKATWLGHACFLIELPTPKGAFRGARVLFDPVFSARCSPLSFLGPVRYTPAPCSMEEIPALDAICLSHNHYDHTDTTTLQFLSKKYEPHIFAPLGNGPYLQSIGVPDTHIHILDWWDSCVVSLHIPSFYSTPELNELESRSQSQPSLKTEFKITCTTSQHGSNRGFLDRWVTLWSSWVIESGDTGYRTVSKDAIDTEREATLPVCPAFKEIGDKFDGFDLAMIPIGAYNPREVVSSWHAHPRDSVGIFQDVKARKGLGMHWGTWVLTMEPIMEPSQLLKEECAKVGIQDNDFDTCGLGETRAF